MKFLNGIDAQIDNALALSGHTIDEFMPPENIMRKNLGDPSILEAGVIESQFTDKLWFFDPANVAYEKSTDGSVWTSTTEFDGYSKYLFSGIDNAPITIPKGDYLRLTLTPDTYVYLNMLYLYMSTNGCLVNVKIEGLIGSGTPTWVEIQPYSNGVSGWPAHMVMRHEVIPFRDELSDTRYQRVRVSIKTNLRGDSSDTEYPDVDLLLMGWYGGFPTGKRTIYSWDADQNVYYPKSVECLNMVSTVGTGNPPIYVTSTTKVDNFNSDLLDGLHASEITKNLERTLSMGGMV